ncbi:MAG: hypothetical protein A2506_07270 [Elusimicrobia bacterium RIFOXYD12_FULL_66_9]|nr:MAG: hypothetical protein A2506_07270 [Elusimicrobia bacterium RIFOXYD12_FULL_66_9]
MDQNIEPYGAAGAREGSSGLLYTDRAAAAPEAVAPRVLVVDDNLINRKVAVMMLSKIGIKADAAGNGQEALEAIAHTPYALVLMDCHMPEMDGLAATRELRRLEGGGRRLPVIAMTASTGDDLEACREAGMDDSLPKPVRLADLENALRSWTAPVSPEAFRRVTETMDGDREAMAALIREFLESGASLVSVVRSSVAEADRGALGLAAHALRGACLSFGARPLADICSRLESMAKEGQALACVDFADAAAAEFERVRKALDAFVAEPVRPS